jgi:hypothetical protein
MTYNTLPTVKTLIAAPEVKVVDEAPGFSFSAALF